MVDNCLKYNTPDADQPTTEEQRNEATWFCRYARDFRRKWKEAIYPNLKTLTMKRDPNTPGVGASKGYCKQTSTLQVKRCPIKREKSPNARKRVRSNSSTPTQLSRERPRYELLSTAGTIEASPTSPSTNQTKFTSMAKLVEVSAQTSSASRFDETTKGISIKTSASQVRPSPYQPFYYVLLL
jgi:hypothetical protein